MKRTNLVIDEHVLEQVLYLSGEKTYSAAVSRALEEFIRRAKAHRILDLRGSGLWKGSLAVMRQDFGKRVPRRHGRCTSRSSTRRG